MNDNTTMIIDDPDAPPASQAPDNRRAVMLWTIDMPWPEAKVRDFEARFPTPAWFQRAYRIDERSALFGGGMRTTLRLVFLVDRHGQQMTHHFMLQHMKQVIAVPDDESAPKLLQVVSSSSGAPVAVWLIGMSADDADALVDAETAQP